jgi:hypothetical protein
MATQWSDHFAAAQPGLTRETGRLATPGTGHARLRVKRATVTLDLAPDDYGVGDVARLMTFSSRDRIFAIYVSSEGASTVLTADLGLYLTGTANDGAVVDADLFGSALALNGAMDRSEVFAESAVLTDVQRGLQLWQLADAGAGTYATDPGIQFDLALTGTAAIATADELVTVEVHYTAGD